MELFVLELRVGGGGKITPLLALIRVGRGGKIFALLAFVRVGGGDNITPLLRDEGLTSDGGKGNP